METGKIITIVVGAAISIIMLAAVLMPVLTDSAAHSDTFTNAGYQRYTSLKSTDEGTITIEWEHTAPNIVKINDVALQYDLPNSLFVSLVFGENFSIRYNSTTTTQYIGPTNADYALATTTQGTDMTITLASGTMTVEVNSETPVTKTLSYDTVYYPSNSGSWIMKKSDESAYLLKDSSIIIANGITGAWGAYFIGTVEDGVDVSIYLKTGTVDNIVLHYDDISTHIDLVKLDKVTFDVTISGDTTSVTYSYFLVPYEITAERSIHLSDAGSSLLMVIPIMIIVAVILGILAMIYTRYN